MFDAAAHDLRGLRQRPRNRIDVLLRTALRGAAPTGLDEALLEIARAESGTPMADGSQYDRISMLRGLF